MDKSLDLKNKIIKKLDSNKALDIYKWASSFPGVSPNQMELPSNLESLVLSKKNKGLLS